MTRRLALLLMLAVALTGLMVPSVASAAGVQTETVDTPVRGPIHSVIVINDVGDIAIRPVRPAGTPNVRQEIAYNYEAPTVSVSLSNGVLRVEADCPNGSLLPAPFSLGYNECSVDLTITVPAAVTVDAEAGLGDVRTERLRGNEDLRSGLGDIVAMEITAGRFAADTGNGSVQATAIRAGRLIANSSIGDVELVAVRAAVIRATTDTGSVDASLVTPARALTGLSNNGDVTFRVPAGRYAVTAATDVGEVAVRGITRDRRAARTIVARTDVGDVSISGLRAS